MLDVGVCQLRMKKGSGVTEAGLGLGLGLNEPAPLWLPLTRLMAQTGSELSAGNQGNPEEAQLGGTGALVEQGLGEADAFLSCNVELLEKQPCQAL
jgi:hypothetical protein